MDFLGELGWTDPVVTACQDQRWRLDPGELWPQIEASQEAAGAMRWEFVQAREAEEGRRIPAECSLSSILPPETWLTV